MPSVAASLAKVAVASLGGPVAAGTGALAEVIDHADRWLAARPDAARIQKSVEKGLAGWAKAERIDAADLSIGIELAVRLIGFYGVSAAERAELNLDSEKAAATVLSRAGSGRFSREFRPPTEDYIEVCRRAVYETYATLYSRLSQDEVLAEAMKVLLQRTDEQKGLSAERHEQLLQGQTELHRALTGATGDQAPEKPPLYWATILSYRRRFGRLEGRAKELAALREFAHGRAAYWWFTGERWAGKSTLAVEVAAQAVQGEADRQSVVGDDVDVVAYLLSRRDASASVDGFLAAVTPQLGQLLGRPGPEPTLDAFRSLWDEACKRARATDRPLLLVVDALDEDLRPAGRPPVAQVLPEGLGSHGHVLVTTRDTYRIPHEVDATHPLRHATPVPLAPSPQARDKRDRARAEIAALLTVTDAGERRLCRAVLGTLAAARGPLTLNDLEWLTGIDYDDIDLFLTHRAALSTDESRVPGAFVFSHEDLLAVSRSDHADALRLPKWWTAIHEWAHRWHALDWPAHGDLRTPQYLVESYPMVLAAQDASRTDRGRLEQLVGNAAWVSTTVQRVGVDAVLTAARSCPPQSPGLMEVTLTLNLQAVNLRNVPPGADPGYALRQLCLQAMETGADALARSARQQLLRLPEPLLVPEWTTRRTDSALAGELGYCYSGVSTVAAGSDGQVVTVDDNGWVLLWDPAHPGTQIDLGRHGASPWAAAVQVGGRVITGGADRRVLVWKAEDPKVPALLGLHYGAVRAVAALRGGGVATGGADGWVLVWQLDEPGNPLELGRHNAAVVTIAVLVDGRLVTGDVHGRLLLSNPKYPGASVQVGHHDGGLNSAAALPDGRVVTCGDDGRVLIWTCGEDASPLELGREPRPVKAVVGLCDGRLVTGDIEGWVTVWHSDEPGNQMRLGQHDSSVTSAAVLPNGTVVTGDDEGQLLMWSPNGRRPGPGLVTDAALNAVALLRDARVVTGGNDGRVLLWEAGHSHLPTELGRHHAARVTQSRKRQAVTAVAELPDGRVATGGDDGRIVLWDLTGRGLSRELGRHRWGVDALAVLPDGRLVSCGSQVLDLLLWNCDRPGDMVDLGIVGDHADAMAVLPDGRLFTAESDFWARVRDIQEPDRVVELGRYYPDALSAAALVDGKVVTGQQSGVVLRWDTAVPGEPVEFGRHGNPVEVVAALAGGQVLTGASDRSLAVWDEHFELRAHIWCTAMPIGVDVCGSKLVVCHSSGITVWKFDRYSEGSVGDRHEEPRGEAGGR